jgi:hypothetical protein
MPDDFLSDEQVRQSTGEDFRAPAGAPKATCLNCGQEFWAAYASQSCDCRIKLGDRKIYAEWLIFFQRMGFGVLKSPEDAKFPFDKMLSGRKVLTNHLQTDLEIGPGWELIDHYGGWTDFPEVEDPLSAVTSSNAPREHSPAFEEQPTPGLDRHRAG